MIQINLKSLYQNNNMTQKIIWNNTVISQSEKFVTKVIEKINSFKSAKIN